MRGPCGAVPAGALHRSPSQCALADAATLPDGGPTGTFRRGEYTSPGEPFPVGRPWHGHGREPPAGPAGGSLFLVVRQAATASTA